MARKRQSYIKGPFTHRRTEADYMGVLLDAVPMEDWRSVVVATVAAAKAGEAFDGFDRILSRSVRQLITGKSDGRAG
jgi:hypothetical protein